MTDDILRGREAQELSQSLRNAGWAAHTNLVRELACWERLTREVNVYSATVDDYTNDLCSRDYLAQAIDLASTQLRDALVERVASADTTFRQATIADTEEFLKAYYRVEAKDGWWWHVRPASGPLATYLESSG